MKPFLGLGVPRVSSAGPWYQSALLKLNNVSPSYVSDFKNNRYYKSGTGVRNFPYAYTRASNATMYNTQGRVVWAPANGLNYSNNFLGTTWSGSLTSRVAAPGVADPFGGIGAYLITAAAGGSTSYGGLTRDANVAGFAITGVPITASVYVKAGTSNFVGLRINQSADALDNYTYFNLTTGVATLVTPLSGTNVSASMTNVGNGWWRCQLTFITSSNSGLFDIVVPYNSTGGSTGPYTGTETIYVYGAQIERYGGDSPKTLNVTAGTQYYGSRFDTDPNTLTPRGLLLEDQSTNLVAASNDQTNTGVWANTVNMTKSGGQSAPNGLNEATLLTITTASGARVETGNITITNTTTYTASAYFKAGTANAGLTLCDGSGNSYAYVKATLTGSGTIVTGGAAPISATIQKCQGGWYRVSITWTSSTTAVRIAVGAWDGSADTFQYPTAAIGGSVYVWGVQCEAKAGPTSLIPTYNATATRAQATFNAETGLSTFFSSTFTQYIEFVTPFSDGLYPMRMCIGKGTSSTEESSTYDPPNMNTAFEVKNGSTNQCSISTGTVSALITEKVAGQASAGNFKAVKNGGTVTTTASGTFPSGLDRLSIGNGDARGTNNNVQGVMWVREVRIYPTGSATDAQLQSLTT